MAAQRALAVVCSALAAGVAAAPAAPPGLQPADLHRLQSVVEARISPDGARIAYSVRDASGPGAPAVETRILEVASGRSVTLGPAWMPRWSPDGRRIAYRAATAEGTSLMTANADGSGPRALAPLRGTNDPLPATGEALAWSPDGRRLAFVSAQPGSSVASADPVVVTRYLYKPTASEGATRFSDGRRLHVFVVDVEGGPARQLTSGEHHDHSIAWSPAGDEIAFVSDRDGDERVFNYDLWAVRVADSTVRRLTDTPSAEYAPAWSPDGRRLAFLATRRPLTSSETTIEDEHAWVMDASGAGRQEVGAAVDNRQGEPAWSPQGDALLLTVQERGDVALYRIPLSDGAPQRIVPARTAHGVVGAWSIARTGTLAYALATEQGPSELYVRAANADERRLTALNGPLLGQRTLGATEALRFPSFDGTEIEAFLTLPAGGPAAGARHPLIVILHGGPHAQQGRAFNARAQVYAAHGWASLQVNYRGSTGYGQKLADAIFGDQDGGEARDVLAAVDAALARHPWLDPERIGVEGGSYGGQLVNWLVTQTGRFRAGVSIAGISNLVSFNYTAYYHDYLPVEFGAYPHEAGLMDRLWERSPLRYVARVRTPVLLLHGENDNDVPVGEAEQFYVALQEVGVPTVMVRYPREGHGLRETAHVVDALQRSIEWYETWFARPRPEPRSLTTR